MEQAFLEAQIRRHRGSKDAAKLRRQGRIPAIVYGHKQEPLAVSLDLHDFTVSLHHGHRLLNIKLDGGTPGEKLLVKDVQYDHLGKDIIHADLMRVDLSEKVRVAVAIELKGIAKGTHEGGIIEEHVDHLEIECRVTDIPEVIPVLVKDVGVGDALHAGDVPLPEGVELASNPRMLLVSCGLVAAAKSTEEVEEEIPVAPEVIGKEEEDRRAKESQGKE